MNLLKNIAGRIMAAWALVAFSSTLLLIFIPVWICTVLPEPRRTRVVFIFYRFWMTSFFVLSGVRRKICGRAHFQKGETYVVVCNHRSLMDPPLSSPAIPAANKTIAKMEMARIPVFNVIYKGGSVLVDRKSEESRRKSYARMKEVLNMGLHMCIYPEGTRNKSSQPLGRFHDGAFRLAIESGKRIMPSVLFDTHKVLPRKAFFFWPRTVRMHFLPPVDTNGKTVSQLKEEVYELMKNYYLQHQ